MRAAPGPTVLRSLCPDALPRALWAEAFGQALYAGALAALEAGYAAVGLYLVRRMEEWTAETVRKPCKRGSTVAGAGERTVLEQGVYGQHISVVA